MLGLKLFATGLVLIFAGIVATIVYDSDSDGQRRFVLAILCGGFLSMIFGALAGIWFWS